MTAELISEQKNAEMGHLATKAKIMGFAAFAIVGFQAIFGLIYHQEYGLVNLVMQNPVIILTPVFIIFGGIIELKLSGKFKQMLQNGKHISDLNKTLITVLESSFPTAMLLFLCSLDAFHQKFSISDILASPPAYVYFLIIILTSLTLNEKLCRLAGIIAAVEFSAIIFYYNSLGQFEPGQFPLCLSRGAIYLFSGVIAGFISREIKKSVFQTLQTKNEMINTLDFKVKERTAEIESQKQTIEKHHDELKEKNQNITDSILYAKRIQKAIIPSQKKMKAVLGDHFVLFRPKDIVSGDFFWGEKFEENGVPVTLFTAADCTGHGVPGAMVSMIGVNGLNKLTRELQLRNPGNILDSLSEFVESTFREGIEDGIADGMDMALVKITRNEAGADVVFSGANNPLWIMRKGSKEIEIIKGNKQPIGKHGARTAFDEHSINLIKGDVIYIFSDGYPDQFGGPNGKKFKYKQLREILQDIYEKDMNEQREYLDNLIETWMDGQEQIDDICIIGLRV